MSTASVRVGNVTVTATAEIEPGKGPRITEMRLVADAGKCIDYSTLRALQVSELAREAARDTNIPTGQTLAERIDRAVSLGLPVRKTVAAELGISLPTLDRRLRAARDRGEIGQLSRRPARRTRRSAS